jgi:hypothetical protein
MISITLNKTLMKEIHNNQKSIGKSIPANGFVKIISRKKTLNQKSRDLCQMFVIFQKDNHTLGYGFKNLKKTYSLG